MPQSNEISVLLEGGGHMSKLSHYLSTHIEKHVGTHRDGAHQ